ASTLQITKAQTKDSRMVSKSGSHLQRCHRGSAPRNMGTSDFFHVTARRDSIEIPSHIWQRMENALAYAA
ncbi:MAG TPA: hypothetical protein VII40_21130, partial [Xanthobacteraceae bacterium]